MLPLHLAHSNQPCTDDDVNSEGCQSSRSASEFAAMQYSAGFFSRKGSSAGSDAEGVAEELQKEPSRWLQPCQLTMAKY